MKRIVVYATALFCAFWLPGAVAMKISIYFASPWPAGDHFGTQDPTIVLIYPLNPNSPVGGLTNMDLANTSLQQPVTYSPPAFFTQDHMQLAVAYGSINQLSYVYCPVDYVASVTYVLYPVIEDPYGDSFIASCSIAS